MSLKSIAIESASFGAAGCLLGSIYSFSPEENLEFFQELATGAVLGVASRVASYYLLQKNDDFWKKRGISFGVPFALRTLSVVKGNWYSPLVHFTNRYGTTLSFMASIGYSLYQMHKAGNSNAAGQGKKEENVDAPEEGGDTKPDPYENPTARSVNYADRTKVIEVLQQMKKAGASLLQAKQMLKSLTIPDNEVPLTLAKGGFVEEAPELIAENEEKRPN
jgi:hypothetical protein